MGKAISEFMRAATVDEVRAAYAAMLEWSDAPEGLEPDDIDNMLSNLGLPSLFARIAQLS